MESNHKKRTPVRSKIWPTENSCGVEPQAAHALHEQHTTERSTLIQNNVESNHKQRSLVKTSTSQTEHSHSKHCGIEPQTTQTFHNQHMPIGTFSFKNCGGEPQGTHAFLASCTGTKSNSSYLVKRQKQNLVRKQTTRNCLLARNKTTKQSTTRVCLRRLAVERKLASEEKKGQKQRTPAWK